MAQIPIAYIAKIFVDPPLRARDGISTAVLWQLVDQWAAVDIHTPATPSLVTGHPSCIGSGPNVLPILADTRLEAIGEWAAAFSSATYASILACACDEIDKPRHIGEQDAGLLLGHGMIVASRGLTGRPLIGMSLQELRRELVESRQHLSDWAGYPVRILVPTPNTLGNATDGLVLEEARRAGYELVCQPGRMVSDLDAPTQAARGAASLLNYRIVRSDDSPEHLRDWVLGKSIARGVARVRDLINRPRRILSRFGLAQESGNP